MFYPRVDIELTNRCNAKCSFCPRDQTPHQGLMSVEAFEQSLARAVEYRQIVRDEYGSDVSVSLCGLGEPLLNKHAVEFVAQVKAAGFRCTMSTNAALLDEAKGRALLDAGLDEICINVGERDDEYEQIYQLPFARTEANVVRFAEMAGDDCAVVVVLVDHRRAPEHNAEMKQFWQDRGINCFQEFDIINRAGALFVDHMQFEQLPELAEARRLLADRGARALCGAPFGYLFIGYDGLYYLCCSDWRKEVPLGSVFDVDFLSIMAPKLRHVVSRSPICRTCNIDPLNMLTEELQALGQGQSTQEKVDELVAGIDEHSRNILSYLDQVSPGLAALADQVVEEPAATPEGRKLIPLQVR